VSSDREIASAQPAPHAAPPTLAAPVCAPPAEAMLSLQQRAGNRSVGSLIARRMIMRRPKAPAQTAVVLSFVPTRAMTAREFAVEVWAQFYGITGQEAERRVALAEAAGRSLGTGPHFADGVTAGELGKPIRIGFDLPGLSGEEQEDVQGRGRQFAGMPAGKRSEIDQEADRRFWRKTGLEPGTKLGLGGSDAANRALWMRTRDEVVRDHNRIELLPPRLKDFLLRGGRTVAPEEYATVVRIAAKLEGFGEDDWALYLRRVNASTDDYGRLERSVDRFQAQQAAERAVRERVEGSETLYKQVKDYKARYKAAHTTVGRGALPVQVPAIAQALAEERETVEQALTAAGFASLEDYDAACAAYLLLFRRRALELTLLTLRASEQLVQEQIERYAKPAETEALFAQQARLRSALTEALDAERRAGPTVPQAQAGIFIATPEQQAAGRQGVEARGRAEAERTAQAESHPILKDPKLKTWTLNVQDAGELAQLLREDAADRLADIQKTRARVYADPETVFQFDRIVAMALSELGATPGTVGAEIVHDRVAQMEADKMLLSIATFVLAIGLGALTFGTGTVAVLASAGGLVLSAYQAGAEWEHYTAASAAAHTAFDAEHAVSSDDPSPVWVALALIGVGLDGAALISAMRAATPALRVLEETGSAAKFEAQLAKATELGAREQRALLRAQKTKADFDAAAEELRKAWRTWLGGDPTVVRAYAGGIDPDVIDKLIKVAYYAAKDKVDEFAVFLARLRTQKWLKDIDFDSLTKEQLDAFEDAWKKGVAQFKGEFAIDVPYSSGSSRLTLSSADEILIEGRPIGQTERDEVIKQLGLTHANRGHGAKQDTVTIANEALKNAEAPKGAGMSGQFSSDGEMLRYLELGRAQVATRGVPSGSKWLVDVPLTTNPGRVFIAKTKLPAGVTPIDNLPIPSLPGVAELVPTHVRVLFDKVGDTYVIFDLFPGWKP
jgi:hypothetical protein